MFAGWATATEAAAFGVLGSLLMALGRRVGFGVLALGFALWLGGLIVLHQAMAFVFFALLGIAAGERILNWQNFLDSLKGATRLSCMIMFILAGASFLSSCMAFTGIPRALAEWVASLNPNRYMLIAILAGIYIVLGTALDGVSMIVLTTSIVIPMVEKAGFDLVWFGIFIVLLVEIAELTPPLGFNIFVLQTMTGRDSNYVALASLPFFFMMVLCIAVITVFPELATWLPDALVGVTKK
jgi:TRAP-type C4-dicarboxylate transport system permease large subunit